MENVGGRDPQVHGIAGEMFTRNGIPAQHLVEIQPVDGTERINAEDGRDCAFVFNVCEAALSQAKFVRTTPYGDLLASPLHIAECEVQPLPRPFELFACPLHAMILAV